MKVCKFGGSSVAGAAQFQKVRHIIEADETRSAVVVSAAGKRDSGDHKLTDLLYLCHAHLQYGVSCEEILSSIEERFVSIRDELGLSYDIRREFEALRRGLGRQSSVDDLVSRGEYFTARLMAEYLGYVFVDAVDCVFFGMDGQVDREKSYAAIRAALAEHGKIVIPGFYGRLPTGRIKLMSRGGSDITGALVAAALDAEVYENWTDVSGILMADPRIVEKPRSIATATYAELRELAFMGASVLHEDSIQPVKEKGIPLNIRNTNEPEHPGTMIVSQSEDGEAGERFLTGVAGRRNFTILTVTKRDMSVNIALRQALEILERYRVTPENLSLGLDSFALLLSTEALGEAVYDVIAELKKTCRPDDVRVQDGIALVAAVGRRMTFRPGISGRLFRALGEHGVNVRTIAQGADELSILVGVDNEHFETAIRVMYHGFAL